MTVYSAAKVSHAWGPFIRESRKSTTGSGQLLVEQPVGTLD